MTPISCQFGTNCQICLTSDQDFSLFTPITAAFRHFYQWHPYCFLSGQVATKFTKWERHR